MGNQKKQDWVRSGMIQFFRFFIHYEITWLCWYQMAQPEICIDVTVMRKRDLTDFSRNWKKIIWRVNAKYSTNVVRVGLKLFRNFYDCDDKSDREARYEFFAKSTNENHRQSWFWSCLKRSKITLFFVLIGYKSYRLSLERSKVKWTEFLWIQSVDILCH